MFKKMSLAEKIVLAIVIALMIAVVTVGCIVFFSGNSQSTDKKPEAQLSTELETKPSEGAEASEARESAEGKKSEKSKTTTSTASSKSKTSSSGTSSRAKTSSATTSKAAEKSSATSSKPSSSASSESSTPKSSAVKPQPTEKPTEAPTHASSKVCTVNGVKCYVGDTIEVTMLMKTPVKIENYQGYTLFDSSCLTCNDYESTTGAGFINALDGEIRYNESRISGIDLTAYGAIYKASFTVNAEGSTELKNTLQVVTDTSSHKLDSSKCKVKFEIK